MGSSFRKGLLPYSAGRRPQLCRISEKTKRLTRGAFPRERAGEYRSLVEALGYADHEELDYGFLSWRRSLCLDSEPCVDAGGEYGFAGFPRGSCPQAKEGNLEGFPIRCVSWEALYFEMLGYIRDIPGDQWRPKDFESLRLIEASLHECARREVERLHAGSAGQETVRDRPEDGR